jgi:DNA-binding LacI/PurR family transcriptional regulator
LHAFRREVTVLGLDRSDELLRQGDFSSASGYSETCALLALTERPTAIVAASDLMALAAMQAIRDAGLQPGPDVAVVGFDDLEAAALAHPPLTTIRQDRQELGTLAATRAIELIEDAEAFHRLRSYRWSSSCAAPRPDPSHRQPVTIGNGRGTRDRLAMKSRYQ